MSGKEKKEIESKTTFETVFNSGTSLVSSMSQFLREKELFDHRSTSKQQKISVDKINWVQRIKQDIGPDAGVLINVGETAQEAYMRHMGVIAGLAPVNTREEMIARMNTHPNYYFSRSISDTDFARVFANNYLLIDFARAFPAYAHQVINRVFDNPTDFARVFSNNHELRDFARAFPAYAHQVINRVFDNPTDFTRVFSNNHELRDFARAFPAYAETAKSIYHRRSLSELKSTTVTSSATISSSSYFQPGSNGDEEQPDPEPKQNNCLVM